MFMCQIVHSKNVKCYIFMEVIVSPLNAQVETFKNQETANSSA